MCGLRFFVCAFNLITRRYFASSETIECLTPFSLHFCVSHIVCFDPLGAFPSSARSIAKSAARFPFLHREMLEMDYRKSSSACARIRCLISRAVYKTLIIHICTASFVYDTSSPPVRRICILHNIFDASGERENDEIERWLF
jgi:hypothetical protein